MVIGTLVKFPCDTRLIFIDRCIIYYLIYIDSFKRWYLGYRLNLFNANCNITCMWVTGAQFKLIIFKTIEGR